MFIIIAGFMVAVAVATYATVKTVTRNSEGWLLIASLSAMVAVLLSQQAVDTGMLWLAAGFAVSATLTTTILSSSSSRWREEDKAPGWWETDH
jgi:hypothetical protein